MTTRSLVFLLMATPALLAVAPAPARAQGLVTDGLITKVPFRFVVGDTVLPAGRYEVQVGDMDPSVVWIVSHDGRRVAVAETEWGGSPFQGNRADLTFKMYGGMHFLATINIPGDDQRTLPVTRQNVETELVRRAEQQQERRGVN